MFAGRPLVQQALERLAPQVSRVMISANRNLEAYQRMGVPVWVDPSDMAGYEGPLAGFLAGLQHCETEYMATVPCDCPRLPVDLVRRLSQALAESQADIAVARTPKGLEPAFCLIKRELQASLHGYMQSGQRKIERWTAQHRRAEALFDDDSAFFNINTPDDLARG